MDSRGGSVSESSEDTADVSTQIEIQVMDTSTLAALAPGYRGSQAR